MPQQPHQGRSRVKAKSLALFSLFCCCFAEDVADDDDMDVLLDFPFFFSSSFLSSSLDSRCFLDFLGFSEAVDAVVAGPEDDFRDEDFLEDLLFASSLTRSSLGAAPFLKMPLTVLEVMLDFFLLEEPSSKPTTELRFSLLLLLL